MPIPRTDNELMVWLNNFSTAFAAHATALGFTAADVSSVGADAAMLSYLVGDLVPTYKSALRARSTYKNIVVAGQLGRPATPPPPPPARPHDAHPARHRPARHPHAPAQPRPAHTARARLYGGHRARPRDPRNRGRRFGPRQRRRQAPRQG